MADLEDVLTNLDKHKESLKEQIKFIEKLERLFGSIDAAADIGAESIHNLINYINEKLIYNEL